jgi:small subunit ribosomal protein S6
LLDKYENIINGNSGKILKTESWGLRNLSYEIKSNKKGLYFHIKLEGDGKTIQELEREENIDQMLLRFLTIKVKKIDLNVNYFEKKE